MLPDSIEIKDVYSPETWGDSMFLKYLDESVSRMMLETKPICELRQNAEGVVVIGTESGETEMRLKLSGSSGLKC